MHLTAPFHPDARRLRRLEVVELLIDAVGLELVEGCAQLADEMLIHCHDPIASAMSAVSSLQQAVGSRCRPLTVDCLRSNRLRGLYAISKITFPAAPDLMAWIASSARSSGKRWVITGVGSNIPDRRKRVT